MLGALSAFADEVKSAVTGEPKKPKTRAGGARDAKGAKISESEYNSQVSSLLKGDVRMFSGCKDDQTSADVSNVASFGLPKVSSAESAGGACTNALLSTVNKNPQGLSYGNLLVEMQKLLKQKRYTQVPQLSSSRKVDLQGEKFAVKPGTSGRTRSLLIGINYFGQKGELAGCVNDVKMMKNFIVSQGYSESRNDMRILTDDKAFTHDMPTTRNIIAGLRWLVEGAKAGDSLFLHYSGHGGQLPDDNGDEEDGYDETLIPVDYASAGQIRDDDVFKLVVAPLQEGVKLVCVFDCCHSGTILDLPYEFSATDGGVAQLQSGSGSMKPNSNFNLGAALAAIADVAKGLMDGDIAGAARGLKKLL